MPTDAYNLDRLLADPAAAASLSREQAATLLARLSGLQVVLVARLTAAPALVGSEPGPPEDRLLTPAVTAGRLGVKVRWLYRHAPDLPFTRRLSLRTLRFSEAGIARFLTDKKALKGPGTYA